MRFVFNSSVQLAPGGSLTFTFQLQIPTNATPWFHACNTAGFNATSVTGGYTINPVESPNVCVEVHAVEVPPTGCCKDLLKKITETHSVSNDVLNVKSYTWRQDQLNEKSTVSLVQFEVRHPADCDVCVKIQNTLAILFRVIIIYRGRQHLLMFHSVMKLHGRIVA